MSVFPCQQLQVVLQAEEAGERKGSEEQRVEEGGGGVFWWLWDVFLSTTAEVKLNTSDCGTTFHHILLFFSNLWSHLFVFKLLTAKGQLPNVVEP